MQICLFENRCKIQTENNLNVNCMTFVTAYDDRITANTIRNATSKSGNCFLATPELLYVSALETEIRRTTEGVKVSFAGYGIKRLMIDAVGFRFESCTLHIVYVFVYLRLINMAQCFIKAVYGE